MKPMKVRELIETLRELDQEALVVLSKDSEGNSFSLMANEMFVTVDAYLKKELGSQDQYFEKADMEKEGDTVVDFYDNKTEKKDLVKCIILWPTN